MHNERDCIAAIATGVGGALAIVRLSGDDALAVAARVWRGRSLAKAPRTMRLGPVAARDGSPADRCLAVYMPGPRSYTGQDVVEFHCHGGQLVARTVLAALLAAGARAAEPGEFTKRAFLEGKLDLTQAEAVADLIAARSQLALTAANRQLDGLLGRRVGALYDRTRDLLAEVEVRLDFVDEDLDWQSAEELAAHLADLSRDLEELLRHREEGEILRDGLALVIVGQPNAGKSSLLNLLLGRERAIVTPVPGTTRDTLEESAQVHGIPLRLIDTAGLRDTADEVERLGVARSYESLAGAQLVLWVVDASCGPQGQRPEAARLGNRPCLTVLNKADLVPPTGWAAFADFPEPCLRLCATTGAGLEPLRDALAATVWQGAPPTAPELAINARQAAQLAAAREQLAEARHLAGTDDGELLAVNLRAALDHLGQVLGRTADPDLLGRIFGKFCIGK